MRAHETGIALRTMFRPLTGMPARLQQLLDSIDEVEAAASEARGACASLTIRSVIDCTDDAGNFDQ